MISFAKVARDWIVTNCLHAFIFIKTLVFFQLPSAHDTSPLPITLSAVILQNLLRKHNNGTIGWFEDGR
jgi:hypothetical protein